MASILIVEDEPMCLALLERLLQMEGHTTLAATDGRQALTSLGESVPDLILLDLMMPVMDGCTFLSHLRRDSRWQHLPVIVLTAVVDRRKLMSVRAMGVRDCLLKGMFSYDDLMPASPA